jgi:hypothetical protein
MEETHFSPNAWNMTMDYTSLFVAVQSAIRMVSLARTG